MNAQIIPVGPKKRSEEKLKWIGLSAILALGGLYFYDASAPAQTHQGDVINKYRSRTGNSTTHKIDIDIVYNGDPRTVTASLNFIERSEIDVGDRISVDVSKGRMTGWLHTGSVYKINKK